MSKSDVRQRLLRRGIDEETASDTVEWLENIGILNDEEYSAMLVRHYAAKGYGEGRIKNELFRHGIEKDLWNNALENMPDMDEEAYLLLCKKLSGWNGDEDTLRKASEALRRRGFSWDEVRYAAEKLRSEIRN
ncbi:MAG: recombination regulator RecX [Clostridiales bacterium]|nr:recombination regulator RecX [Clostridiales bacterium]